MAEKNSLDWVKVIMGILMAGLAIFGIAQFTKAKQEEAARIAAQNEIALMSDVIEEKEGVWSRLSVQQEDIIEQLREENSDLATTIEDRDANILAMSEAIARFSNIRVVVRPQNVVQEPVEDRIRVAFTEEVDPIRVEGFTLTDPPEAEVTVGFTRPLQLRTVITQEEDGSWRTYIEGDYPNLEIEQIETVVNPFPERGRTWVENISIGGGLHGSTQFDAAFGEVFLMYTFDDSISVGPSAGVAVIDDEARFMLGAKFVWYPWR